MLTFLIDTNVLVACRDLKDLDRNAWSAITSAGAIHIIVPDTVNREIDKLKEDGRSRRRANRARLANTLFKELALTGLPKIVRAASPKISISLAPLFNKKHAAIADFDLDDEDSWIVAEAKIFIHEHPDVPTSLISHDGRMIHLAKTHGVPIYDVPDCWRLEPESDEPARRIQDLEKRLQKYENQEPTIEFSIAFPTALVSDPPLIRKIVSRPLTPQQIDELIEKARTYHPMTTNFEEPFGGSHLFVADPFSKWEPPSSSEIAKYQNVDYPTWIDGLKSTLTLLHLQFNRTVVPVEISLQNTGSRPARSLRVRFQLFGSAFFLPPDARQIAEIKELTLPPPPAPPSGRRTNPFFQHQELLASLASTVQFSGPSLSDQLLRTSVQQRRKSGEFYWSPEKPKAESNIWSFECEDFRHQDRTETFSALIDLTQETNTTEFSLECTASAANLTKLKKEYVPFRIEAHEQDFFDVVDEVFGRVGTWRPKADKD